MKTRIAVLSSSRADFGIYRPLLDALIAEPGIVCELVAFGTHLSRAHGYTVSLIESEGYTVAHGIEDCFAHQDDAAGVAAAMARTLAEFGAFWAREPFDLAICLGDRYEMFSAVAAAKPFGLPVVHLYGGETTLGAIDEAFRHCLSHLSSWHLTGAEIYAQRVRALVEDERRVFNVGYLSLDTLSRLEFMSPEALSSRCGLDLSTPTLLCTFHPETVSPERNAAYAEELCGALRELQDFQVLVTMPNADTRASVIRAELQQLASETPRISAVESLGSLGYLSAMRHCVAMVGNTSSGFVEASYFPKPVINLGDRQRGRHLTPNIIQTPIERGRIIEAVAGIQSASPSDHTRIYGDGHSAASIMTILREHIIPSIRGATPQ